MYNVEAATNAGLTPEKARKRGAEVHQAGLHLVLEAIRELCAPSPYRFANRKVYTGEVRLVFIMGDQVAHNQHVGWRKNGCRMCSAPHDRLTDTDEIWPLFDWRRAIVLYSAMLSLALTTMGKSYMARGR